MDTLKGPRAPADKLTAHHSSLTRVRVLSSTVGWQQISIRRYSESEVMKVTFGGSNQFSEYYLILILANPK